MADGAAGFGAVLAPDATASRATHAAAASAVGANHPIRPTAVTQTPQGGREPTAMATATADTAHRMPTAPLWAELATTTTKVAIKSLCMTCIIR